MARKMGVFRGGRLAELRKRRGYSQEELADRINTRRSAADDSDRGRITQQHISKWESGTWDPSPEMLVHIAAVINASVDYLLGLVGDEQAHFTGSRSLSEMEQRLLWALEQGYITEALESFTELTKGRDKPPIAGQ